MAWLREVVVVVVAELGVGGVTARAFKLLLFRKVGFHGLEQRWILHSRIPKRDFSFQARTLLSRSHNKVRGKWKEDKKKKEGYRTDQNTNK